MRTERPDGKSAEHVARREGGGKRGGAALIGAAGGGKGREVALRGIRIAPGVAIGPLYDTAEIPAETPRRTIGADAVEAERARLVDAVALSRKQLGKLKGKLALLPDEAQHELAPLLEAYVMMLGNSRLLRGARKRIEAERLAAETAVLDESESIAA